MPTGIRYENEALPPTRREIAVSPRRWRWLTSSHLEASSGHGFGQQSLLNLAGDAAVFLLSLQPS
jgi:hypothetical protein